MAKRKPQQQRSAQFYGCLGIIGALIVITVVIVGFNLIRNAM